MLISAWFLELGSYNKKSEVKWNPSVVSDSLWPNGLQTIRLLRPWDFPGKSAGVDCHFLLQGIFLTQESNLSLQHCRQTLYHLSHQGSIIRKRSPKWWWLKDKERKKPMKMDQKKIWGLEWEIQVKQTAVLASPIYIGQAQGEETKYIKRGAKIEPLLWDQPTLVPWGRTILCLLNKTEL